MTPFVVQLPTEPYPCLHCRCFVNVTD